MGLIPDEMQKAFIVMKDTMLEMQKTLAMSVDVMGKMLTKLEEIDLNTERAPGDA
jgi:hypothetical protein